MTKPDEIANQCKPSDHSEVESLLIDATNHVKNGALEPALERLNALLALDSNHEIGLGMQAALHAELKHMDEAATCYRQVLSINPENVLARVQLGLVLLELNEPQAAVDTWQPGQYSYNEYLINYYRGTAYLQMNNKAEALNAFQKAREFMPVDHVLYRQLLAFLIQLTK
jgi:tetratricopeptide (TPR) repeat protein